MKKILTILLAVLMSVTLFGCDKETEKYDVVFLADMGTVNDGGFNQYSYKGIEDYCKDNNLKYTYLQPAGNDDASRKVIFEQAVNQMHANVLVAVGYLWDAALVELVPEYPDTKVIFVDADNLYALDTNYDGVLDSNDAYITEHCDNLSMITFAEQDCGFMAGYAIVMEGYRKLGFFGGMAVPAVIRFGYGWLEGAEAAAKDLGLEEGAIECNYYYTGTFDASPELVTFTGAWYSAGTEVIFSCGGTIVNSCLQAANEAGENAMIVGVDTDEYFTRAGTAENEPKFITSAMKSLDNSIYDAVAAAYKGGDVWAEYAKGIKILGAAEEGAVIAPYRAENWKNLTEAQYNDICNKAIELHSSLPTDADGVNGAPIDHYKYVKVNYVEK